MTIAGQLRAIADRLEAAEAEKAAALDELWQIRTVASYSDPIPGDAAVLEAAGAGAENGSTTAVPSAPIEQAGPGRSPGRESAAASPQPTVSPAPPGKPAFDPLGPKLATVACPECDLPFSQRGLGVHRRHVHRHKAQLKAPATCPDCGKRIAQGQNLKRHRQMVHGGQKLASTNGAAPVIRRGVETFLCSRCPMRFESREKLDNHLLLDHPDTTPRRLPVGQGPARSQHEAAERMLRGGGFSG